jgi:hypothetical protein
LSVIGRFDQYDRYEPLILLKSTENMSDVRCYLSYLYLLAHLLIV